MGRPLFGTTFGEPAIGETAILGRLSVNLRFEKMPFRATLGEPTIWELVYLGRLLVNLRFGRMLSRATFETFGKPATLATWETAIWDDFWSTCDL